MHACKVWEDMLIHAQSQCNEASNDCGCDRRSNRSQKRLHHRSRRYRVVAFWTYPINYHNHQWDARLKFNTGKQLQVITMYFIKDAMVYLQQRKQLSINLLFSLQGNICVRLLTINACWGIWHKLTRVVFCRFNISNTISLSANVCILLIDQGRV